jgi:hypothetical protein
MRLLILDFIQRLLVLAVVLCMFVVVLVIGVAGVMRMAVFNGPLGGDRQ